MKNYIYGNVSVSKVDFSTSGKIELSSGPYEYFFYNSNEKETICFDELKSFSIYLLKKAKNSSVKIKDSSQEISEGSVVQVENKKIQINVNGGNCTFIIAGIKSKHPNLEGIFITENKDIYKINKPWGHELWINGKHLCYALKQIFIKSGYKTSLQYHNFKKETIILLDGRALLHYQKNTDKIKYIDATIGDIEQVQLDPISIIDTEPCTIHRMESKKDIIIYEASTPHLDDVIRISDDTNRLDGHIPEEHVSK